MWLRTFGALMCLAAGGAGGAAAACRQADLAGTWDVYATHDGFSEVAWTVCLFQIAANGTLRAGSTCVNSYGDQSVISGRLVVQRSCVTGGRVIQRAGFERLPSVVPHATLAADKGLFVGIGVTETAGSFVFQAIKR